VILYGLKENNSMTVAKHEMKDPLTVVKIGAQLRRGDEIKPEDYREFSLSGAS
jgi:hypothetical protein